MAEVGTLVRTERPLLALVTNYIFRHTANRIKITIYQELNCVYIFTITRFLTYRSYCNSKQTTVTQVLIVGKVNNSNHIKS